MRNHLIGVVVILVALGLLALFAWGVIRGIEEDPALVGSLLTAGLTVIGGIAAAGYQGRLQRRETAERVRREKITDYYEDLIRYVTEEAERADSEKAQVTEDDLKFIQELQQKLLLWSGPEVIQAWVGGMRRAAAGSPAQENVEAWGRVLKAIRAELGHDDSSLDLRDLLRVIITDADQHFPKGIK